MTNARVNELKAMDREDLDALAQRMGIEPHKSKTETARRIEQREFVDRRAAQKLPLIKEIF